MSFLIRAGASLLWAWLSCACPHGMVRIDLRHALPSMCGMAPQAALSRTMRHRSAKLVYGSRHEYVSLVGLMGRAREFRPR